MKYKIPEDDKIALARQVIDRKSALTCSLTALVIKEAEHPLYSPMHILSKSIKIKEEKGGYGKAEKDLCLSLVKQHKRDIHRATRNSIEYVEYLRALQDFNEVKALYIFAKKSK